jgi:hypothetical protein
MHLAIAGLCAMCLHSAVDRVGRRLWAVAVILAVLVALESVANLLTDSLATDDPLLWRLYRQTWFQVLLTVAYKGLPAAVAIAAARSIRRRSSAAIAVVVLVVLATSIAVRYVAMDASSSEWLHYLNGTVLPALALGGAAVLCWIAAANRGAAPPPPAGSLEASPDWLRAADGLGLYSAALVWRLAITFGGYALLSMAMLGRSAGLARLLMWALPLGALATGVMMFAGIVRFSGQPSSSPGRPAALFAAATMAITLVLDLYLLVLMLGVSGESGGYDALATASRLGPWTMALGFASLGALLFSFGAIAGRIADPTLRRRVGGVAIWLGFIALSAVGLRMMFDDISRRGGGSMIAIALVVGVAALAVLIAYVGLVRAVEAKLRQSDPGAGIPTAVVVDRSN